MNWQDKIRVVQKHLKDSQLDGWLLYYFDHNNPFVLQFLETPKGGHLSRRFFYWIPAQGVPVQIVHQIEPEVLAHLPGDRLMYMRWQELQYALQSVLKGSKVVAMEYSPLNHLPYISKVDAGTVEMVKACGIDVVSSSSFLQYFTCVMSSEEKKSQKAAGQFLDRIANDAFAHLSHHLKTNKEISEYALQQWVLQQYDKEGFFTEHPPICAFGVNTADPHYTPHKEKSAILKKNEPILLDFVAKKKGEGSVYGDITRVGFSASKPSRQYETLFNIVKTAQSMGFEFIQSKIEKNQKVRGFEVDEICRRHIEQAGYGAYFTHRTGHNVYKTLHGPGAHLDNFETLDDRYLIPGTCFTIEPGIYLPKEMGVRVEYDVILHENNTLEITSGIQQEICLIG